MQFIRKMCSSKRICAALCYMMFTCRTFFGLEGKFVQDIIVLIFSLFRVFNYTHFPESQPRAQEITDNVTN